MLQYIIEESIISSSMRRESDTRKRRKPWTDRQEVIEQIIFDLYYQLNRPLSEADVQDAIRKRLLNLIRSRNLVKRALNLREEGAIADPDIPDQITSRKRLEELQPKIRLLGRYEEGRKTGDDILETQIINQLMKSRRVSMKSVTYYLLDDLEGVSNRNRLYSFRILRSSGDEEMRDMTLAEFLDDTMGRVIPVSRQHLRGHLLECVNKGILERWGRLYRFKKQPWMPTENLARFVTNARMLGHLRKTITLTLHLEVNSLANFRCLSDII